MEAKNVHNQIVITTRSDDEKQKLPVNLFISLAAGAIAGVAIIFALFWGAEMLFGI